MKGSIEEVCSQNTVLNVSFTC
ncbi:hypothetical protein CTRU02_207816 [Colletotrichum truncatum]|uniref:Uncharacterized protein n=1 Tax=Colletotrichum truncatum TaxID=5467 RepID=A0ACC3Z280_COLTU|nr:hypothetical protein CTRU02_15160 [Colletotrichum truncatum]